MGNTIHLLQARPGCGAPDPRGSEYFTPGLAIEKCQRNHDSSGSGGGAARFSDMPKPMMLFLSASLGTNHSGAASHNRSSIFSVSVGNVSLLYSDLVSRNWSFQSRMSSRR